MTDAPKFAHSPIHVLPNADEAVRALQNPNHPFYVGKVTPGRNAIKIAAALVEIRKNKGTKK